MISESEIYEIINFVLLEMKNNDSLENYQGKYIVDKIGKPSFFILRKDSKEINIVELDEMHSYIGSKKTVAGYGLLLIDMGKDSSNSLLAIEVPKPA